jgi:hypothetical protein
MEIVNQSAASDLSLALLVGLAVTGSRGYISECLLPLSLSLSLSLSSSSSQIRLGTGNREALTCGSYGALTISISQKDHVKRL